ncbi:hypothetical protein [Streptomyces sp. NPDC002845]
MTVDGGARTSSAPVAAVPDGGQHRQHDRAGEPPVAERPPSPTAP